MKDKEIQGIQIRICNACKQYKKCDKELCTMSGIVAKELSRFYQPKLSKDSVVLTKEEYNDYINLKELLDKGYFTSENRVAIHKTRKETAKEILERGKYCMPSGLRDWIKERYGVEV